MNDDVIVWMSGDGDEDGGWCHAGRGPTQDLRDKQLHEADWSTAETPPAAERPGRAERFVTTYFIVVIVDCLLGVLHEEMPARKILRFHVNLTLGWPASWCRWMNQLNTDTPPGDLSKNVPFSDRQHLSYDVCVEVRGEIIRTVLCCIVYWSCAQS